MSSYRVLSRHVTDSMEVECDWKILDWPRIQRSAEFLTEQTRFFEVGLAHLQLCFRENERTHGGAQNAMMCLKLMPSTRINRVIVKALVQLLNSDGSSFLVKDTGPVLIHDGCGEIEVGTTGLQFGFNEEDLARELPNLITSDNGLVHKIRMLVTYDITKAHMHIPFLDINSVARLQENLESLMYLEESHNFKIITKDRKEFIVNKHMLASRCPVFESMFRSNMQEEKSGEVRVKDVSGPAMEILVKFWYTGKLASNWKEPNVLVDFVRAVGKYDIPEILDFLDKALGEEDSIKNSFELVELTNKFNLKQAEKNLVRKMVRNASDADTLEELSDALGLLPSESD